MNRAVNVAIAVAIADSKLRGEIREALEKLPVDIVEDNWHTASLDELLASVERLRPAILFLSVAEFAASLTEALARLGALACPPQVVAVNGAAETGAILQAMRAGAAEFVYPPFQAEFEESMSRLIAECGRRMERGRATGSVIGFVSAKGGCGATTIACHTASHLRRAAKKEVLLADVDLSSGIAGALMQANSRYNLSDALQSLHRMDLKLWKALVATAPSGVDVMPGPAEYSADMASAIRKLPLLIHFWRNQYEFAIIDFGHGMTQSLVDALDSIDMLVLVATNELPALRQAKWMIQALAARSFGANRLKLVINRMPKRASIDVPELEKVMSHPIHCALPNDYQALSEAYSEPRLLAGEADLSRRMGEFAEKLTGIAAATKPARRFFAFR